MWAELCPPNLYIEVPGLDLFEDETISVGKTERGYKGSEGSWSSRADVLTGRRCQCKALCLPTEGGSL